MGDIRKTIGENIKKICAMKGIKQVDLALQLGVSPGTVSNWFKGTNSIDIENLASVCSFLKVSLDQIYGVTPILPDVILEPNEQALIDIYRAANAKGKEYIMTTARMVAENHDMQREKRETASA